MGWLKVQRKVLEEIEVANVAYLLFIVVKAAIVRSESVVLSSSFGDDDPIERLCSIGDDRARYFCETWTEES